MALIVFVPSSRFKEFENDDQAFWEKVIGGSEPEVPTAVMDGSARLRASESNVIVNNEIVDSLWEEDFASLDDRHIIDDLQDRLRLLGLDPAHAAACPDGDVHVQKRRTRCSYGT